MTAIRRGAGREQRFEIMSRFNMWGMPDAIRLNSNRWTASGLQTAERWQWRYSNASNKREIALDYDRPTQLDYLDNGLLDKISFPGTGTTPFLNFHYDAWNLPSAVSTYHWDYSAPDNPVPVLAFERAYQHDSLDALAAVTSGEITNGNRVGVTRTTEYDELGRLSHYRDEQHTDYSQETCDNRPPEYGPPDCWITWVGSDSTLLAEASYTYDANGNRTDSGATFEGVGYPGTNRLHTFAGYSFTHDAAGNVTRKYKQDGSFDQQFTWNSLGELTRVVTTRAGTAHTIDFAYDGRGRRARKTVDGVVTQYLYNGDQLAVEMDGEGQVIREYSYYPGTDNPHLVYSGAHRDTVQYYLSELPGHVVGLATEDGQVTAHYRYDPWGQPLEVEETSATQPLRWGGREYDAETGLYFFRARYYDPELGRFLSEDPIGLAGGIDPYAFADDDPVNLRDPSGMDPCYFIPERFKSITNGCAGVAGFVSALVLPPLVVVGQQYKTWYQQQEAETRRLAEEDIARARAAGTCQDFGSLGCTTTFSSNGAFCTSYEHGDLDGGPSRMCSAPPIAAVEEVGAEVVGRIGTYKALRKLTAGTDLEVHHLLEKRFAPVLGEKAREMLSIVIERDNHQILTNMWRNAISYGEGTASATRERVLEVARNIYANNEQIMLALKRYFGE